MIEFLILAQNRFDKIAKSLNKGFSAESPDFSSPWLPFLGTTGLIALLIAVAFLAIHLVRASQLANPKLALFDQLCRGHQLSWREVWLIKTLAGKLPERDANLLFVDQQAYEQASQLVLEETRLNKRAKHQQRLNSLAQKLFTLPS